MAITWVSNPVLGIGLFTDTHPPAFSPLMELHDLLPIRNVFFKLEQAEPVRWRIFGQLLFLARRWMAACPSYLCRRFPGHAMVLGRVQGKADLPFIMLAPCLVVFVIHRAVFFAKVMNPH